MVKPAEPFSWPQGAGLRSVRYWCSASDEGKEQGHDARSFSRTGGRIPTRSPSSPSATTTTGAGRMDCSAPVSSLTTPTVGVCTSSPSSSSVASPQTAVCDVEEGNSAENVHESLESGSMALLSSG